MVPPTAPFSISNLAAFVWQRLAAQHELAHRWSSPLDRPDFSRTHSGSASSEWYFSSRQRSLDGETKESKAAALEWMLKMGGYGSSILLARMSSQDDDIGLPGEPSSLSTNSSDIEKVEGFMKRGKISSDARFSSVDGIEKKASSATMSQQVGKTEIRREEKHAVSLLESQQLLGAGLRGSSIALAQKSHIDDESDPEPHASTQPQTRAADTLTAKPTSFPRVSTSPPIASISETRAGNLPEKGTTTLLESQMWGLGARGSSIALARKSHTDDSDDNRVGSVAGNIAAKSLDNVGPANAISHGLKPTLLTSKRDGMEKRPYGSDEGVRSASLLESQQFWGMGGGGSSIALARRAQLDDGNGDATTTAVQKNQPSKVPTPPPPTTVKTPTGSDEANHPTSLYSEPWGLGARGSSIALARKAHIDDSDDEHETPFINTPQRSKPTLPSSAPKMAAGKQPNSLFESRDVWATGLRGSSIALVRKAHIDGSDDEVEYKSPAMQQNSVAPSPAHSGLPSSSPSSAAVVKKAADNTVQPVSHFETQNLWGAGLRGSSIALARKAHIDDSDDDHELQPKSRNASATVVSTTSSSEAFMPSTGTGVRSSADEVAEKETRTRSLFEREHLWGMGGRGSSIALARAQTGSNDDEGEHDKEHSNAVRDMAIVQPFKTGLTTTSTRDRKAEETEEGRYEPAATRRDSLDSSAISTIQDSSSPHSYSDSGSDSDSSVTTENRKSASKRSGHPPKSRETLKPSSNNNSREKLTFTTSKKPTSRLATSVPLSSSDSPSPPSSSSEDLSAAASPATPSPTTTEPLPTPLPGTFRASTLLLHIASTRKWTAAEIACDLEALQMNRLRTVDDLRALSGNGWGEMKELLPVVKDLLRRAIAM
ncbi:hypothetical protein HK102_001217 [Quaeritorhiza haematococci]|nr:hypothetical protein HK102_001217 [Quaeritorhiza haematococci]